MFNLFVATEAALEVLRLFLINNTRPIFESQLLIQFLSLYVIIIFLYARLKCLQISDRVNTSHRNKNTLFNKLHTLRHRLV